MVQTKIISDESNPKLITHKAFIELDAFIFAWFKDTIKYISIYKACESNWLITWKLSAKNSSKLQSYD